jgi:hypothetical protein
MPTISGAQVFSGAGSVANVLSGSQYEFAPFDGTVEIGLQSSAQDTSVAIFSGPDTLQEPGGLVPCRTAGTITTPNYPDDYLWEDEVAKGDRIKINLTAGTACTVRWVLRMTPA